MTHRIRLRGAHFAAAVLAMVAAPRVHAQEAPAAPAPAVPPAAEAAPTPATEPTPAAGPAGPTPGAAPAEQAPAPSAEPVEPGPAAEVPSEVTDAPTNRAAPPSPRNRGGYEGTDDESDPAAGSWAFGFHGYFRAPIRVGMNERPSDASAPSYEDPGSDMTLHEPVIPDDQTLSFQHTIHNRRSLGDLYFSYGNAMVQGVINLRAHSLTEGAWSEPAEQLGINQAYLDFTPDLGVPALRLRWRVGGISDIYGVAGRYDTGEYDTYLFGRTHVMGETLRVDYDVNESITLRIEHGIGTKRPHASQLAHSRYTLLNHAHLGLTYDRKYELGLHFLQSFAQEEWRPYDQNQGTGPQFARNGLPDGSIWVAGIEGRADLGAFGYLYAGFSHINAENALTVAPAIEVLHAQGGGEFGSSITANYLDSPGCSWVPGTAPTRMDGLTGNPVGPDPDGCSDGNGSVNAIMGQYEFGLKNLLEQSEGGRSLSPDSEDVRVTLYGVVAMVKSEARDTSTITGLFDAETAAPGDYETTKIKFGADILVQALPSVSPGLRFDQVSPDGNFSEQAFGVISPRIEFKSNWVTRERITLQYSRYFYNVRECDSGDPRNPAYYSCTPAPSEPIPYEGFGSRSPSGSRAVDGPLPSRSATGALAVLPPRRNPDENVFKVEATMWW
jgi:hypothetical protein